MKGLLFSICALLLIVAICSTCCGQPKAKAATVKPARTLVRQAPAVKTTKVVQKAPAVTMPTAPAIPAAPTMPAAPVGSMQPTQPAPSSTAPAPAAAGAGPTTAPGTPTTPTGTAMTVDGNFVYVMQDGKVYRYPKSSAIQCSTAVPAPCEPCPTCAGMTYIPGFASTNCTVTTSTPCPPPCQSPCPAATGAGPCAAPCPNSCQPAPCPTSIVRCTPNIPQTCNRENPCGAVSCNQCNPNAQPTVVSTTCATPCGSGAGPSACPPIATVSTCTQAIVDALQTLCGADMDKAYLQALIQINAQVMALSDASVVHLGTTSLQDYATNSIGDSRSRINKAENYLRTKFCLVVAACASGAAGLNVCEILCADKGAAFDAAYKKQLIQYYVDEIAISQVEIDRGLDCEVKTLAATVIKQDQQRIERLQSCGACM